MIQYDAPSKRQANGTLAGPNGLTYAPLTGPILQQMLGRLDALVGPKAACIIGNWMGGAPSKSMLGKYQAVLEGLNWTDAIFMVKGVVKVWSGAAGAWWGGKEPWTIEASCPDSGMTLDAALALLFTKCQFGGTDPQLFNEVMGLGTAHREKLVAQQDAVAAKILRQEADYVAAGVKNAAKALGDAADTAGFLTRNAVPIMLVGAALVAFLVYRKVTR